MGFALRPCYKAAMTWQLRLTSVAVRARRLFSAAALMTAVLWAGEPAPGPKPVGQKPELQPPAASDKPKTNAPAPLSPSNGWEPLFDGKTLTGWKVTDFAGKGEVQVKDGTIFLGMGYMTGITRTSPVPRMNYELSLEAMRVEGSDFFCGLTFPVGDSPCSLIVGGWGGSLVGLSSLDDLDASSNETTRFINFENRRWYRIRLRVQPDRIQAWIDEDKVVDVDTTGRKISIRWEMEESKPLGIATWSTAAALRNLRIRKL